MKKLNVAIIGGGVMAKAHSMAYACMPMFFWPAPAIPVRKTIVDINDELAEDAKNKLGFENFSSDWEEVINDKDIDVVDICTPNNTHPEMAIAAAKAGKHIICEKPLARNASEAKDMYEAVKKSNIIHMVAFNYRRTPAVALAKKIISENKIGKVLNFRGTYLQDWPADPNGPLSWRFQKEIAGSGTLGDIGTHVVDFARYLVGEIKSVNAIAKTYIKDRPIQQSANDTMDIRVGNNNAKKGIVDVDDEIITMLKFSNGAVGTIEASRNAYGRNNFLTFEIHGSQGSIIFNYERRDELKVMFADSSSETQGFQTIYTGPAHPYGGGLWPIPALGIGYGETKIIECYDFFNAIKENKQPSPNFEDGYIISKIADSILESNQKEKWINI